MEESDNAIPASKKRAAERQITQLDPEPDDDVSEPETGTFKKASEEVLATRRIIKVQRHQPPSAPESAPSSNPFAGLRFVSPTDSGAKTASTTVQLQHRGDKIVTEEQHGTNEKQMKIGEPKGTESGSLIREPDTTVASAAEITNKVEYKVEEATKSASTEENGNGVKETETKAGDQISEVDGVKTDKEPEKTAGEDNEKAAGEEIEKGKPADDLKGAAGKEAPLSSFQQLSSSQNAFTGIAGTGFSAASFSFGSVAKEGSAVCASSGSLFGFKNENPSFPLFNNVATDALKNGVVSSIPPMQDVPVETGEENEKVVFNADAIMYEYFDEAWKERGKGEIKVNISISDAEKARLVMRARGNYRLILNASLYSDMTLANMDKRGITFACVNSAGEGKSGFSTFALKFKDSAVVEEFRRVVAAHKGKRLTTVSKTPENSPKATDD